MAVRVLLLLPRALLCTHAGLSLSGRKVAVFGCGDQHGYGDYFCDAMEELYSSFAAAGCDMVGHWPTEGYEHSESKVGAAAERSAGAAGKVGKLAQHAIY